MNLCLVVVLIIADLKTTVTYMDEQFIKFILAVMRIAECGDSFCTTKTSMKIKTTTETVTKKGKMTKMALFFATKK